MMTNTNPKSYHFILFALLLTLLAACSDDKKDELLTVDKIEFSSNSIKACVHNEVKEPEKTKVTDVTKLLCSYGRYSDTSDLAQFENLEYITFADSKGEHLDLSGVSHVENLRFERITYDSLGFSTGEFLTQKLVMEDVYGLKQLNLNPLSQLTNIRIIGSSLEALEIDQLNVLFVLFIQHSNLISLDISQNFNLKELWLGGAGNIQSLDTRNLSHLNLLSVTSLPLIEVMLDNVALKTMALNYTQVKSIDLTLVPNLKILNLKYNQLENIDLSYNFDLNTVYLEENPFTDATVDYLDSIDWIEKLVY